MKALFFIGSVLLLSSIASAECYTSKIARDAVRAVALVTNRAMITDLVGGYDGGAFTIWANYRNHGYADKYEVKVEPKTCRVISLNLLGHDLPVKDGD